MIGDVNKKPLDRFTVGHAAFGYLLAGARVPNLMAIGTIVGWEIVERYMKRERPEWFPNPSQDTFLNASFDIMAALSGYYLYGYLERRGY